MWPSHKPAFSSSNFCLQNLKQYCFIYNVSNSFSDFNKHFNFYKVGDGFILSSHGSLHTELKFFLLIFLRILYNVSPTLTAYPSLYAFSFL